MHSKTTKLKQIKCDYPKIDSLSLRIELSQCEVIDQRLTSETAIYYESIQMLDAELSPPKPIVISKNGITTRIRISNIPIYNQKLKIKVDTKFITLTLSAKLLKFKYFEGITPENVNLLYTEFMEQNIFKCTFDTFLNSKVSDIDICEDRYFNNPSTFEQILKQLISQTGNKIKYTNLFNQESNLGLEFNNRYKATPSLPYLKFYFKYWELQTKSLEFNTHYLQEWNTKNIGRVEATIKNYKHKKRLESKNILPKFETLKELLQIDSKKLHNFITYSLNAYITIQSRIKNHALTIKQNFIFQTLQIMLSNGYDYKSIENILLNYKTEQPIRTQETAKYRAKKELKYLFDLLIHKDIKINMVANQNAHVNNYLKYLKIQ